MLSMNEKYIFFFNQFISCHKIKCFEFNKTQPIKDKKISKFKSSLPRVTILKKIYIYNKIVCFRFITLTCWSLSTLFVAAPKFLSDHSLSLSRAPASLLSRSCIFSLYYSIATPSSLPFHIGPQLSPARRRIEATLCCISWTPFCYPFVSLFSGDLSVDSRWWVLEIEARWRILCNWRLNHF